MRVLLVSNTGFQYLASVIPAMERNGVAFRNVSTDDLRVHQKRFVDTSVRAIKVYYFDRAYLQAFRQILKDFAPDLVHITGLRSTLLKTLAALRAFPDIPLVYERISAGGVNFFNPAEWMMFRHKRVKRIVMPSQAMLNNWMGHPLLRRMTGPGRCEVLHYAVDLPPPTDAEGRRAIRRSLGLEENAFIVGSVCIVRPWKNVEFVADVVSSIKSDAPIYFAVVGPEHGDRQYMDRIRSAGGSRLRLLGRIPNAKDIMPAFDVYVTPTELPGESFGVAFAEAMSHGVPSLTMNFGASAELCEHGVSGYAIPYDKRAWQSVIEMLMHDPAKRAQIGEAARRRVATHFAPDAIAENYLTVYRRVLAS
jgi:glycosyltransferase involved in cell wall biosynthesis